MMRLRPAVAVLKFRSMRKMTIPGQMRGVLSQEIRCEMKAAINEVAAQLHRRRHPVAMAATAERPHQVQFVTSKDFKKRVSLAF